MQILGI